MKLLTLDPSSTRTGYAVSTAATVIIDAGVLNPRKTGAPAEVRIPLMVADTRALITEHRPTRVLIEWPTGRVHGAIAARSRGQGQSLYGAAVGAIWQACIDAMPPSTVELVTTHDWTVSKTKQTRVRALVQRMPGLARTLEKDTGLDMADAIGMGVWWWDRQTIEQVCAASKLKAAGAK